MAPCTVSLARLRPSLTGQHVSNAVFLTAIPSIFQDVYGFSVGIASLHYIPLGMGMYGGAMILSRTMDRTYASLKEKADGVGKPEFRLRENCQMALPCSCRVHSSHVASLVPGTILLPAGILITGWTAEAKTHWICPDIVRYGRFTLRLVEIH